LESLPEGSRNEQKSEYSLTQHLANNLIDMYINLPSKNHYRRPASFASKGYRTRRMAVDFAVPLITNVKNAKLLAEALVRKLPLDVSSVDSKSSHETYVFPGLINVAAFVPHLNASAKEDLSQTTKASVSSGFTTAMILPFGDKHHVSSCGGLIPIQSDAAKTWQCSYVLSVVATANNADASFEDLEGDVKALYIPSQDATIAPSLSVVASHFASWPADKIIVTDAKGSDLASMLLLASLYNRSVHVTDVQNKDDILLISLSKAKHLKVTCDVSVYALFFTNGQFPNSKSLPSPGDQAVLWKNLDVIDIFSVGSTPYRLALETDNICSPWSGMEETLPLLLTAVTKKCLTLTDIQERLHDNPMRIFGLPEQSHVQIEVMLGRSAQFEKRLTCWSPLEGHSITGAIRRVMIHGQTVFLDGSLLSNPISRAIAHTSTEPQKVVTTSKTDHGLPSTTADVGVLSSALSGLTYSGGVQPQPQPQSQPQPQPQPQSQSQSQFQLPGPHIFSQFLSHPAFHRRHILEVKQFTQRDIYDLFSLAHEIRLQVERTGTLDILKGKILCNLFYEPSTRTSMSFDAAMKRCGGDVISVNADSSSVMKGENLPDTIRALASYADAIVIRHPEVGSARTAAKFSPVPIINAGDGTGEHPTQARLFPVAFFLARWLDVFLGFAGCVYHSFRAWYRKRTYNYYAG
jgi:carbamoyl-phosphate synthase/aspartate carbamoyltransferase